MLEVDVLMSASSSESQSALMLNVGWADHSFRGRWGSEIGRESVCISRKETPDYGTGIT